MRRRDFLRITGAVAALNPITGTAQSNPAATVLFEDRSITLDKTASDSRMKDVLWVRKVDLPRINGFEIKPQGACRADVCIPIPKDFTRGDYFNLNAFAGKVGQAVVTDPVQRVWSFGEIPVLQSGFLDSRVAPDFAVPDRKNRIVHLSDFRGKKVLVVTWASW